MKRFALVVIMLLIFANGSLAVFNSITPFPQPDGARSFKMQQGWWNGMLTWFIMTETSDRRFAQVYTPLPELSGLTYTPLLANTAGTVPSMAKGMAIVINNSQQMPVFENSPHPTDASGYSGIWAVYYVKWRPTATRVQLKSWSEITSRLGTQLDWSNIYGATSIDATKPFVYLDAPIVAIGPLGGPWWPVATNSSNYRLRQVMVASNYSYTKIITLPTWYVYAADPTTHLSRVAEIIITDMYDPGATSNPAPSNTLAYRLGANWSSTLSLTPVNASQLFYDFNPAQRPANQYPVLQQLPSAPGWRNLNLNYTPLMAVVDVSRTTVPFNFLFTTEQEILANVGGLIITPNAYRFNASVLPPH